MKINIFLCGDVMTGRGIDQLLPHPGSPRIHEPYLQDARDYLRLAEREEGEIPVPVDFDYPWGYALAEWESRTPDLRIVNLETSITTSEQFWQGKGINYRMHPANTPTLSAAGIDACALANNHVIDWGYAGLEETLAALDSAGIARAGAGRTLAEAAAPARLSVPGKGRVLLFSFGLESSGIPAEWGATAGKGGVNLLPDLSAATVARVAEGIAAVKEPGDLVIVSLHWGGNWGYEIDQEERRFAHLLLDQAGVDLLHGHSSHHVKGIEVHNGHLILYGCGDFLNDYEGVGGYEMFRGDLALMYFAEVYAAGGKLARLAMVPTRTRAFRIERATAVERGWLEKTLNREGRRLGTAVEVDDDGTLLLRW